MSSNHRSATHCRNCGTPLSGPYCHECGQHDFDFHRSFRHVFAEALENFIHFDGKLFRNMVTLLFSPGRLPAAFNEGKRASQMPPFRLYLFISVLFFFVSFHTGEQNGNVVMRDSDAKAAQAVVKAKKPDVRLDTGVKGWDRWLEERALNAIDHQQELVNAFLKTLPKMLLLCLPLFALTLRVVYRKSGYNYLQQLVVALHFHTFLFLWILVVTGYTRLIGLFWTWGEYLLLLGGAAWLMLYPVIMLRRLFPEPRWKSLVRAGVVFMTHSAIITTALFSAMGVAFAMA